RDLGAAGKADGGGKRGRPGGRLRFPRRRGGRYGPVGGVRGHARGGATCPPRRGADVDRGQGLPARAPFERRRRPHVPAAGRGGGVEAARRRSPLQGLLGRPWPVDRGSGPGVAPQAAGGDRRGGGIRGGGGGSRAVGPAATCVRGVREAEPAVAIKTLLEAIREALIEEMRRDERVFVLGEDVGKRGGVFRVTQGLIEEFGPDRVLDTPLAESLIVGVAIGAAAYGLLPVAEIQFADFIHPAMDQIINEAAKIRYRSNGRWSCPIVIRAPYGGGVHGALYHSQSVEALFYHVPGLKIVAPATPYDAKGLLKAAIRDPDPVLFFEHKKAYRSIRGEVPDEEYVLPIGKADIKRPGQDLTVITYGYNVHLCLEAAERLAREEGI